MSDNGLVPARFTISDAAKREIDQLSEGWTARIADDPAAGAWISWAEWRPHVGEPWQAVFVTVYGRAYGEEIAEIIQEVSGVAVLFTAHPDDAPRFNGKVVDFHPDQGFFLREP